MAPKLIKTTVLIDSRDRDFSRFPTPSEYVLDLPEKLYSVRSARLITAEMPKCVHTTVSASMTVTHDGVSRTIAIPDGCYTREQMLVAVNASLSVAFGSRAVILTENPQTNMLTLTSSAGLVISVASGTLADILGFADSIPGSVVAGISQFNIVRRTYFTLNISDLGKVREIGATTYGFAKIPMNLPDDFKPWYDKFQTVNAFQPAISSVAKVRVNIKWHDGTLVDFRGSDHSFTVEFEHTLRED